VLEHTECPRCHAPNLAAEICCFACGARLKPLPKRLGGPAAPAPWPLWIGLVIALGIGVLIGYQAVAWLAGYRARAALPTWYLPAAGLFLVAAGQMAFWEARRHDRRWWRLRRAPELSLSQASVGDVLWARGQLRCDTPLVAPYIAQLCAYYRYLVRERQSGRAGWRVTEHGANAVDFSVADQGHSIYVPSGGVLFDAPFYGDTFIDPEAAMQVHAWALLIGVPVSVCGQLTGDTSQPRLDPLGEGLPAVATWRSPQDYVALVGKRAKAMQICAWALTIVGALALIAGLTRV